MHNLYTHSLSNNVDIKDFFEKVNADKFDNLLELTKKEKVPHRRPQDHQLLVEPFYSQFYEVKCGSVHILNIYRDTGCLNIEPTTAKSALIFLNTFVSELQKFDH